MKLFVATRSKRKMADDVFDRFKFTCQDDKGDYRTIARCRSPISHQICKLGHRYAYEDALRPTVPAQSDASRHIGRSHAPEVVFQTLRYEYLFLGPQSNLSTVWLSTEVDAGQLTQRARFRP